jgi:hypothetical protein
LEYTEGKEIIPDRFGDAFLTGSRKDGSFNADFEESLKI